MLGRMAGVKAANYAGAPDFSDVAEEIWYAPFVKWAAQYGITSGTGDGKFSPDNKITREELAVFFVRYFEIFGATPETDTAVTTKPADLDEVSPWAQDAVLRLWSLGLLNGDGERFTAICDGGEVTLSAGRNSVFSVFCLGADAEGVTIENAKYPLSDAALTADFPLGVSNHFIGSAVRVTLRRGCLLIGITDKE